MASGPSPHGGRLPRRQFISRLLRSQLFRKLTLSESAPMCIFLSHDLLEGRGTGQRGGDIAARIYRHAIRALRAEAGRRQRHVHAESSHGRRYAGTAETTFSLVPASGSPRELKPLTEYVAYDETQQPDSTVNADIVFVGYGIEAPEYKWDDYKGVDVKGKVLLMLVNEPTSDDPNFFKGKALTYYGRWIYKFEKAARKGAVGAHPDP